MPLRTTKHWFGVVLDAPDPSALAHFYADLLGWTVYTDTSDWATIAPSETHGYNVAFQREPNYVRPVWPSEPGQALMMLHLDFEVDDLEAATQYALGVGAERADHQPQTDVRVLLDPAGHPFCLYVDDSGEDGSRDHSADADT